MALFLFTFDPICALLYACWFENRSVRFIGAGNLHSP